MQHLWLFLEQEQDVAAVTEMMDGRETYRLAHGTSIETLIITNLHAQ
ncbi:MAG: hypothetical protein IPP12_20860 [Nitrospira sp.]|nr:hypothetical protein [Nitrospira sp.]